MTNLTPFATRDDLQEFWRPLATDEIGRADSLLIFASNRLRLMDGDHSPTLDERKNSDEAYATTLRFVVLEAVKRALQTPSNIPPVNAFQQAAGPYSEQYTFTNPSGDLWFKKSDLALLGISGTQKVTTINGTEADIY